MSSKIPAEKLKIAFSDIIRGSSTMSVEKYGEIYVKHFTNFDSASVDDFLCRYKDKAAKEGLLNEKDKLEILAKDGLWDAKKDAELEETKRYVKNLLITKSKLFLKSEIDRVAIQIKEAQDKAQKIERERAEIVGITVEGYAMKKANERYIFLSLFKEEGLKTRYFNDEEFEELTGQELYDIIEGYNSQMGLFGSEYLKKVAVSNFFLNFYYLCEDNPYTFYGKPIVNLTYYQLELFGYGRYFKQILSDSKTRPPEEMMDDPDQIIEWYESNKNAQKVMQRSNQDGTGGTSIVGATKDDLKRLGMSDEHSSSVSLSKEAAKKGGNLSMEDIMKLHGIKMK